MEEKLVDEREIRLLEALITDPTGIPRLEDYVSDFNMFEVLGVQRNETRHSAFIAWMLDPRGTHGLGDYFLRRFLWKITTRARGIGESNVTAFDVDRWYFSDVTVETERHNIDILLTSDTDGFICSIENKLFSTEHSNQLERYRDLVTSEYPDLTPLFVLLTIDGDTAQSDRDAEHYVPLSYSEISDLLSQTLEARSPMMATNVAAGIEQYLSNLRRHVLAESEIQELARRIYADHREAIDLIIEAKPDARQEVRDIVESVMESKTALLPDHSSKTAIRYCPPEWDEIPELKEGTGWTESGRVLLLEFRNNTTLSLHLVLGIGPQETRKTVFDSAERNKRLFNTTPKNLTPKWASLYRKRILSANEHAGSDRRVTRQKIETAIEAFVAGDLVNLVSAVESAIAHRRTN